jgi:hypothetical protein
LASLSPRWSFKQCVHCRISDVDAVCIANRARQHARCACPFPLAGECGLRSRLRCERVLF